MALNKSFKDLVQRQVARIRPLRRRCCARASRQCSTGDVDTGKTILRDYIKATIGFEKLGRGDRYAAEEPDPDVRAARNPQARTCSVSSAICRNAQAFSCM